MSTRDVTPNFKPEREPDTRTTAQKRGSRNRRSGMRYQREVRKGVEKLTGSIAARFAGQLGNEEAWHGLPWRVEVKSGMQSQPAVTSYLKARDQSDATKAIGDHRPFVHVVKVARVPPIAVIALEDLPAVLETLQ